MLKDTINDEYFEWLFDLVCDGRFSKETSYRKLLMFLHNTPFRYSILRDENRAHDGIDLRRRFSLLQSHDGEYFAEYLDGPCSVLEMMIGLAIRCEEAFMDDTKYGNRTAQWFWEMINNLGLGSMIDIRFNKLVATDIIQRFLDRDYEPDGKGGLFTIKHCNRDLRNVEIWYQMCWYLDSICDTSV